MWRSAKSLVVALSSIVFAFLPAIAQDCPDLKAPDRFAFPAGQNAAAVSGPQKRIAAPKRHIAIPEGSLGSVIIRLERSECYGTCPSYSIELRGDGSATYVGKRYVLVEGTHTFKLPTARIECLLSHFKQADFWSLRDKYIADITDLPEYRISLSIGGKTKTVTDYAGSMVGMPKIVSALEEGVDRLGADRWVRGDADTIASLQAEHFDFHSQAAARMLVMGARSAPEAFVMGLIEKGVPLSLREPIRGLRPGTTAVEGASRAGRLAIVRALIAKGGFAAGPVGVKEHALQGAAASGDPAVVAEILKYHPDVDARDWQGDTALMVMVHAQFYKEPGSKGDSVAVARLLLDAGADPNALDESGSTALFSAASADMVDLLVKAGAKVDIRNKYGYTPLILAPTDAAAVALIKAGADPTATSQSGDTIEKTAIARRYPDTLRLLHARGRKK